MKKTKFCKYCGEKIPIDAVICIKCGRQVEEIKKSENNPIIINNNNSASASASASASSSAAAPGIGIIGRPKNKWIALALCFTLCGHKFYEGKFGTGILYLLTGGLFFMGCAIDAINLLGKPTTYYV